MAFTANASMLTSTSSIDNSLTLEYSSEQCQSNPKNRIKRKSKQLACSVLQVAGASSDSSSVCGQCCACNLYPNKHKSYCCVRLPQPAPCKDHLGSHHLCATPTRSTSSCTLSKANSSSSSTSPSSSLMSNSLINIHRHTSYLCQILELLRSVAASASSASARTTTHKSSIVALCGSEGEDSTTTKPLRTRATPSGTTIIKSILRGKREPHTPYEWLNSFIHMFVRALP